MLMIDAVSLFLLVPCVAPVLLETTGIEAPALLSETVGVGLEYKGEGNNRQTLWYILCIVTKHAHDIHEFSCGHLECRESQQQNPSPS